MAQTDRNAGLVANAAIKNPCAAATTANITLSGAQTIDGVAVTPGDRVLVKNQTTGSENGIYEADTGTWVRTHDCNGAHDLVPGTLVWVRSGSVGSGWYYLDNASAPTIGTDTLTWGLSSSALAVISAFAQTLLDDTTALQARQTLLLDKSGSDIASAATIDLDAATGDFVDITGTTEITGITLSDGVERTVRFTGSLKLTHSASLVLENGNIQTAAGDMAVFRGDAASITRLVSYHRISQKGADIASAATIDLDVATGDLVDVTGTAAITAVTLAAGRSRTVRFTGALTFTNGASLVLPGGADITTAAGDFAVLRGYAGGVVRCLNYTKITGHSLLGGIALGTQQNTTTGSSVSFTIPSGAKRITVMGEGVSADGTAVIQVQIGDAGGLENSGYSGGVARLDTGSDTDKTDNSAAFNITQLSIAAQALDFKAVLDLKNAAAFTWLCNSHAMYPTERLMHIGFGLKSLSAELTTVAVLTSDTLDAGSVNVSYEF